MNDMILPHKHNIPKVTNSIKKELDNIEKFQLIADIFKQLGDTTRVRLFWLLCHCEECVINISAIMFGEISFSYFIFEYLQFSHVQPT